MSKPKSDDIQEMVCQKCGEAVSGPDIKSVEATMKRHADKKHAKGKK